MGCRGKILQILQMLFGWAAQLNITGQSCIYSRVFIVIYQYKASEIFAFIRRNISVFAKQILDVFDFDTSAISNEIKKVDCYVEITNPLDEYSFLKERVKDFIIISQNLIAYIASLCISKHVNVNGLKKEFSKFLGSRIGCCTPVTLHHLQQQQQLSYFSIIFGHSCKERFLLKLPR